MRKALELVFDERPEVVVTREVLDEMVREGFRLDLLDHLRGGARRPPDPAVYGVSREDAQAALLACLDEDGVCLDGLVLAEDGAELAAWAA